MARGLADTSVPSGSPLAVRVWGRKRPQTPRKAGLLVLTLLLSACGGGGGSTAPEEPVEWRGAVITGERPKSGEASVELGWQRAVALTGIPGPEPRGWTVELHEGYFSCAGQDAAGCVDFGARQIHLTWREPGLPEVAEHEFCHFLRWRRTGSATGPGCLTQQTKESR